MAILTNLTYEEALALPGTKHIRLDGSKVIVDTNPPVEVPTTNVVNVRDWGAVGNGIVDDTAAIQAATNYAISKRYTLFFPTGIYLISKPIYVYGKWAFLGDGTLSRIKTTDVNMPLFIFDINDTTVVQAYIGNLHFVGPISNSPTSCAIRFVGDNVALIQHCTFENLSCTDFNAFAKDEKLPRMTGSGLESSLNWNIWSNIHLYNTYTTGFWHTQGSGTGNTWSNIKSMLRAPGAATWHFEGDGCVVGDVIIEGSHLGGRDAITGCVGVKVGPNIKYKSRCSITNSQFDAKCNSVFDISDVGGDEANNWKFAGNNVGGDAVLNTPYMSQSIIEDKDVDLRQSGRRILSSVTGNILKDCFDVCVNTYGSTLVTVKANGLVAGIAAAASEYSFHVSTNGVVMSITEIESMVTHNNQLTWMCSNVDANTARLTLSFTPTGAGSDISVIAISRGHRHKLVRV